MDSRLQIFVYPFRAFINEKFKGSQKLMGERLNLSPSLISQVINGRNPSPDFRHKCIDAGFPAEIFDKLDAIDRQKDLDTLTYEELKFIYLEAKYLIEKQNKVIKILEERVSELKGKVY